MKDETMNEELEEIEEDNEEDEGFEVNNEEDNSDEDDTDKQSKVRQNANNNPNKIEGIEYVPNFSEDSEESGKNSKAEGAKEAFEKATRGFKATARIGVFIGKALINPITWLTFGALLVFIVIMSGASLIGQSDHNIQCLPSGVGVVNVAEDADDFTRQSAITSWLTSTPFDSFGGKAMTKEQAAGVIGSFIVESAGARPNYVETLSMYDPDYYLKCDNDCVASWGTKSNSAIGIAQWDGGRRLELVNFAKDKGGDWYDLNIQLQFLKKELDSTEGANLAKGGFTDITHTPGEYARLWNKLFERSAGNDNSPHVIKRKAEAEKFAAAYKGGAGLASNCTGGAIDTSNAVQLAIQVSWPMGDRSGYGTCTWGSLLGSCGMDFSKPEYIAAKKEAHERTGADPAGMLMASCDRFVATILRATGTDENYPWGAVSNQEDYMKNSPDWERISCQDRQPGDIIVEPNKHIMMYLGVVEGAESLASASHMERSASIMPVSCNGDNFNADSYPNAQGWRKVR